MNQSLRINSARGILDAATGCIAAAFELDPSGDGVPAELRLIAITIADCIWGDDRITDCLRALTADEIIEMIGND